MGRPSDKRRSARRPGKHERARAKKRSRNQMWTDVTGAGHVHVKAGRKKSSKACGFISACQDEPHRVGDLLNATRKKEGSAKRPVYTVDPC
jgi:hypothetical protein